MKEIFCIELVVSNYYKLSQLYDLLGNYKKAKN